MNSYEPGLYLVSTPIGNLGDITDRAKDVLNGADVIACEDTREMKKLLSLIGIERRDRDIISIHEHNEYEKCSAIVDRISAGESVAYASDAGMPGVSDPGAILVDAAHKQGLTLTAIPGATAVTTAFALSGFNSKGFAFVGFFPRQTKEKKLLIQKIESWPESVIAYESPKRLNSTLSFLANELGASHRVCVCRELTKKFEEIFRGTALEAAKHFGSETKGECVIVIESKLASDDKPETSDEQPIRSALKALKECGVSSRDALNAIGSLSDLPKNRLKEIYVEIEVP